MVKNSVHIKNIGELLSLPYLANDIRTRINSLVLDCNLVERQLSAPVFLNAATIILVLSGTAQLNINYRSYFIQANTPFCFLLHIYFISGTVVPISVVCACWSVKNLWMKWIRRI